MGQDIRELLKGDRFTSTLKNEMPENHELRFLELLDTSLPQKSKVPTRFQPQKWMVAASLGLVVGLGGYLSYKQLQQEQLPIVITKKQGNEPSLANISPEFKKVENYYLTSLNVGLSEVNVTTDNKVIVDSYFQQMSTLEKEYRALQKELAIGSSFRSVNMLIENLKFRLELLEELKKKLRKIEEFERKTTYTNFQA